MSSELSLTPANNQSALMAQAESSRAVQEVQAALVIAKKFPRNEKACLDRILNACTRSGLADAAVYQYAKGGTDVSGPSIRLAEALAQNWGNMEFGWRELERVRDQDGITSSVIQAFAWDMETNTRIPRVFNVRHWRDKKGGGYKITDEREIYELCANMAARRVRACVLAIIPGDVTEEAVRQCETTMATNADTSPDAQMKIITAFAKYSVTKEQIEKRIQRRMDGITPAQVVALRKIMASLKDGMSKPEEWFDPIATTARAEPLDPMAKPAAKPAKAKLPEALPPDAEEWTDDAIDKKFDALEKGGES